MKNATTAAATTLLCDCGKPSRGTAAKAWQCFDCVARPIWNRVRAVRCIACGTGAGHDCHPGHANGMTNCPRRSREMVEVAR